MKYDISRTPTRSAKRVLGALSESLFDMLCKKSFELLTVGEICDDCGYPRATFYNYFDDKYDLLDFYWYLTFRQVKFEDVQTTGLKETYDLLFERLFFVLDQNKSDIKKLLVHNPSTGYFINSCKTYLAKNIRSKIKNSLPENFPVPTDVIASHVSNTLLLVFAKYFESEDDTVTKEQTKQYFDFLLGNI